MVLPYYNGVAADDCGISAFVFLAGGHVTLHTFSFRECFFADVVAPVDFDTATAKKLFSMNVPDSQVTVEELPRSEPQLEMNLDADRDFGPHLSLEIEDYEGPSSLDDLFSVFDSLPEQINMTPIMRPYVIRSNMPDGTHVTSAVTMLAESHTALHVFEKTGRAYFDVFSCNFFDIDRVVEALKATFRGKNHVLQLLARGREFRKVWTARENENTRSRAWLRSRPKPHHDCAVTVPSTHSSTH